ncbi:MAG: RNA polymerase factor sigma-32 [Bdellovibrionaceae bacterium]|nr:RNA polymerase factor sigma-32 [Pseudobdellovibrionaceae bacterium]MDW8189520.1 RNA polymerase factor sigma-32 [Pseudobdellovibrionaceae bacterium]
MPNSDGGSEESSENQLSVRDSYLPVLVPSASEKALTVSDPITRYLAEIRKYPLLSREEEFELAKRYYETKDREAAQRLITSNLRFVVKIASEYARFGLRLIDLIQEGNIGLLHALKEYNPYKGVRLITYAVWWIRGYIQEYLMKQYSLVKIGTTQTQKKLFYKLQKEKQNLDKIVENGDLEELAQRWNISSEDIRSMMERMRGRDVSLSSPVDQDSDVSFLELQANETEALDEVLARQEEVAILKSRIEQVRHRLTPKEQVILDERLLADEPVTLQEIADRYGITREAVRQTEARLVQKLRNMMQELV